MFKMINRTFKKFKKEMIFIIFLSVVNSLISGINIVILIPILELMEIGGDSNLGVFSFAVHIFDGMSYSMRLLVILSVFVVLMISKALLTRFIKIYNTKFVQKYIKEMRQRVYDAVIDSNWELFSAQKHDDLLNSFTSEILKTSNAITTFTSLISVVLTSITQIAIAFAINVPLTILILIVGSILFFALKNFFAIAKKNGERMRLANRSYLHEIRSQLNSVKEIKSYGVENYHKEILDEVLGEYQAANIKKVEMSSLPSLIYSTSSTIIVALLIYISNVVLEIDMMNLILIVYIFAKIWPVFKKFHNQIQTLVSCAPSFENLERTLSNLKSSIKETDFEEITIALKEKITFNHVTFTYLNSSERVINDINFSIKANEITALKGKSGIGKSTIVNLLMGLLIPVEGEILVDGLALNENNIRAWRKSIGYMPQDPIILNKSIRENITRFNPGVTDEEIYMALEKAQALEFVGKLPHGLDTLMGNKGVRLSGGEKQRIVLARALASHPSVLILDEATSALDNENERNIQETIQTLKDRITIISIAHRQSTIDGADHVIHIQNNGEIIVENNQITCELDRGNDVG
ncbi:ABC transporter ATP-binding protein [Gottschalkiaceae bacterium SANA]|nr:ABC transporter ATP-binding protein [Gottschalkiaceae bacterium SANA]